LLEITLGRGIAVGAQLLYLAPRRPALPPRHIDDGRRLYPYAEINRENGQLYDLPEQYDVHQAGKAADSAAVTEQVLELELPGQPGWQYEE
jgi:hypothetical protein